MVFSRLLLVIAAASPLLVAGHALACPTGGGNAVFREQETSAGTELFQAARELDRSALDEDLRARTANDLARRQRRIAATLRQRARFSEMDAPVLLAKADIASDDALAAESRARTHTARARAFRARAAELRSRGKRLLVGEGGVPAI